MYKTVFCLFPASVSTISSHYSICFSHLASSSRQKLAAELTMSRDGAVITAINPGLLKSLAYQVQAALSNMLLHNLSNQSAGSSWRRRLGKMLLLRLAPERKTTATHTQTDVGTCQDHRIYVLPAASDSLSYHNKKALLVFYNTTNVSTCFLTSPVLSKWLKGRKKYF